MRNRIWKSYQFIWGIILIIWSVLQLLKDDDSQKLAFKIILILGVILFVSGISHLISKSKHNRIDVFFTIFTFIYIIVEIFANISAYTDRGIERQFMPNSGFGFFNAPCADYDNIRGYRWKEGSYRIFKYEDDVVIYDNTFKTNNERYYYHQDFVNKKKAGTQRWLLIGDSFIASEYLHTPVADLLDSISIAKGLNVEFYPIALCGIGVENWHKIFFKEVAPNLEFDGVVFNVFANDLIRPFLAMHHTDSMGYSIGLNSDSLPANTEKLFELDKSYFMPWAPYLSDDSMDKIKHIAANYSQSRFIPDFYVLQLMLNIPMIVSIKMKEREIKNNYFIKQSEHFNLEAYEKEHGTRGRKLMTDIINYCKQRDKKVLVVQIPYDQSIIFKQNGYLLKDMLYTEMLSEKLDVPYLNSESFFKGKEDSLEQYFFTSDIHWNQKGALLFANHFMQYFQENYIKQ